MPLIKQYGLSGVDVWVWKITETVDELLGMVPAECATYAVARFSSKKRCCEWLAVRAIVAQQFGDGVRIVYDRAGKPVLEGRRGNISISHTKGYAVFAFSPDNEVGVDVELLSRKVIHLAGHFMSMVPSVDIYGEGAGFIALLHWCAKEALFKIVGDLGGNFKDNILVTPFEPAADGSMRIEIVGLGCDSRFMAQYCVDGDLLFVLCRGARDDEKR